MLPVKIGTYPIEMLHIRLVNELTVFLHVDPETLGEPARLALVAAGDVHHASPGLFAHVIQISENRLSITALSVDMGIFMLCS